MVSIYTHSNIYLPHIPGSERMKCDSFTQDALLSQKEWNFLLIIRQIYLISPLCREQANKSKRGTLYSSKKQTKKKKKAVHVAVTINCAYFYAMILAAPALLVTLAYTVSYTCIGDMIHLTKTPFLNHTQIMPGKCLKHFLYSQVFPVYLQKQFIFLWSPEARESGFPVSRTQAHTLRLRGGSDTTLLPVTPNYHHFSLP